MKLLAISHIFTLNISVVNTLSIYLHIHHHEFFFLKIEIFSMFSEYQLFMYSQKKLVYISNCIFHVSFRIFSTLKLRFALEKRCSYSFLIRRTHMLHPKLDSPNLWRRLRSISMIKFNLDKNQDLERSGDQANGLHP